MIKRYRVVKIIRLLAISCLILNISSYFVMAQNIVINNKAVNHQVLQKGSIASNPSNNSVTMGIAEVGVGIVAGALDRLKYLENVVSDKLS